MLEDVDGDTCILGSEIDDVLPSVIGRLCERCGWLVISEARLVVEVGLINDEPRYDVGGVACVRLAGSFASSCRNEATVFLLSGTSSSSTACGSTVCRMVSKILRFVEVSRLRLDEKA